MPLGRFALSRHSAITTPAKCQWPEWRTWPRREAPRTTSEDVCHFSVNLFLPVLHPSQHFRPICPVLQTPGCVHVLVVGLVEDDLRPLSVVTAQDFRLVINEPIALDGGLVRREDDVRAVVLSQVLGNPVGLLLKTRRVRPPGRCDDIDRVPLLDGVLERLDSPRNGV